jgi:alginate O-acetyltransferase complex protein AlgI
LALLPLARRIGLPAAAFIIFILSGLLHEAVISLPARAGFGLPTLYFVLQGVGVAIERSCLGRRQGLGNGMRGWLFVVMVTIGPLYWLFHPAFALRVIVPFMNFLNST